MASFCAVLIVIRVTVLSSSAAGLRAWRHKPAKRRHHLAQRWVIGHDFELALPQIDETRGQRLDLVLFSTYRAVISACRPTIIVSLIHGRNITQSGAAVANDAPQH